MKRFYKTVTVEAHENGYGFEIHLDGRAVKLMETRAVLHVPSKTLAEEIAKEWGAQAEKIIPDAMPLMQIISTQLEKVAKQRPAMQTQIEKYIDTDLLFYRADDPKDLAALQVQAWDPLLDKFESLYGVRPDTTTAITALKQPKAVHEAIKAYCSSLSEAAFTALQIAVPISGSVITGMLFIQGHLTPEEVLSIARVEERHKDIIYHADKYGQDPSIEKADKAALRDLQACQRYLTLQANEAA